MTWRNQMCQDYNRKHCSRLPPRCIGPGLAAAASGGGLSSLQRLVVSKCPSVGDFGLRAVLDGCFALRELSAGGCKEVRLTRKISDIFQPPMQANSKAARSMDRVAAAKAWPRSSHNRTSACVSFRRRKAGCSLLLLQACAVRLSALGRETKTMMISELIRPMSGSSSMSAQLLMIRPFPQPMTSVVADTHIHQTSSSIVVT